MNRLLLGALLAIAFTGNAFAQSAPADAKAKAPGQAAAKPGDEKVDISDLENKYWAPKDTDFSVVQNRTYTKEKRWFFSAQYGIPTSDQYNTGSLYSFTGNYFLSERQGLQLNYTRASYKPNSAISDLANYAGSGVYPNHGYMTGYYGAGYDFVPFYSKMSVMGKRIIYFDMAFTPTLGMTSYDQSEKHGDKAQSAFTYGLDVTQYFFFTNYMALRVDWKNQWYSQKEVYYENSQGIYTEGQSAGTKSIHDSLLLFGVTFFY